jgi:GMP synthase (glutamine-hydrolysing)
VRDRIRILFVNPQENEPMDRLGLPSYRQWIASVAQVRIDQVTMLSVADGEALPGTVEAHGLIGGGSGHSSYEPLPWIERTKEFFRRAEQEGIPELHFCWSHQARVETIGGRCRVGSAGRRFGVERLRLTPAGQRDPLFRGLPTEFDLFSSHVDVVDDVPARSHAGPVVELGHSAAYRHESLAIGSVVRTFQAHPELTADIMATLARSRRDSLTQEGHTGPSDAEFEEYLDSLRCRDQEIRETGRRIVHNWLRYYIYPRVRG